MYSGFREESQTLLRNMIALPPPTERLEYRISLHLLKPSTLGEDPWSYAGLLLQLFCQVFCCASSEKYQHSHRVCPRNFVQPCIERQEHYYRSNSTFGRLTTIKAY